MVRLLNPEAFDISALRDPAIRDEIVNGCDYMLSLVKEYERGMADANRKGDGVHYNPINAALADREKWGYEEREALKVSYESGWDFVRRNR